MMPTGTLMKKTQRQPGPPVSRPLAITPIDADVPPAAPKIPSARVPPGTFWERHGQDRQRRRGHQRGAEPLDASRRDDRPRRSPQPRGERGAREQHQPGHQHPAAADQVGHPPAQEQESSQHQGVGDDQPLLRALGEPELALDGRQCHVHDRHVQHDHELDQAGQGEDDAFAEAGLCHDFLPMVAAASGKACAG
jgi:hypothetical protein